MEIKELNDKDSCNFRFYVSRLKKKEKGRRIFGDLVTCQGETNARELDAHGLGLHNHIETEETALFQIF